MFDPRFDLGKSMNLISWLLSGSTLFLKEGIEILS